MNSTDSAEKALERRLRTAIAVEQSQQSQATASSGRRHGGAALHRCTAKSERGMQRYSRIAVAE